MKVDFKKIINIKNKRELNNFALTKPIFNLNYLFHYLIEFGNINALKLYKFPVFIENDEGLNGFHLAAKYNIDILYYLIDTYPEYIYNNELFTMHLPIHKFNTLLKKYPNLNWKLLINQNILYNILTNSSYAYIKNFIKLYTIKPDQNNQYLFAILKNDNITSDDKIKILTNNTDEEINIKNEFGEGLIFIPINIDDEILFNYLLKRNIDLDYNTFYNNNNILVNAITFDIITNQRKYALKIINKIKINLIKDKQFNNILHIILNVRINRQMQVNATKFIYPELEILELGNSENWNQINIDKISPLELIVNLNYEIYSPILIKNNIAINKKIINKIKTNYKLWIDLFNKMPEYIEDPNDIIMNTYPYIHSTLFQATIKDIGILNLVLIKNHTNLLLPNTYELIITGPMIEYGYPWVISYYSEDEYNIHPYLNNIINSNKKIKEFAVVFLSLFTNNLLHANILIYDFKKMIIERFEPYGNSSLVDENIDKILEEELTWSTGFTYKRPKDYLPFVGFQTISDETNKINTKAGDYGGFCLVWCYWYLETKLLNKNIDSKILVEKLINKLIKLDIKFSEYIRNYSNKLNQKRVNLIKHIGIDEKEISNSYQTNNNTDKINKFLLSSYANIH